MRDAIFVRPDLTTFCGLDALGLEVIGQRLEPDRAVLVWRVADEDELDRWCRRCGGGGTARHRDPWGTSNAATTSAAYRS
jgi:hypothetical protein